MFYITAINTTHHLLTPEEADVGWKQMKSCEIMQSDYYKLFCEEVKYFSYSAVSTHQQLNSAQSANQTDSLTVSDESRSLSQRYTLLNNCNSFVLLQKSVWIVNTLHIIYI